MSSISFGSGSSCLREELMSEDDVQRIRKWLLESPDFGMGDDRPNQSRKGRLNFLSRGSDVDEARHIGTPSCFSGLLRLCRKQ
jgi:hypothetical protein